MPVSTLPPGFRFHPTDIELVCYYLKRRIAKKSFQSEAIQDIELYKFAPWDLPDKYSLKGNDLQWYFFCLGEKKYTNGSRKNRMTDVGYWKTTGRDKSITYDSRTVAMKKTLVFHEGKVKATRTDWVMHEYRLEDRKLAVAGINQGAYVLCKIFQKSGRGPKIGEQYGAPFREEDWEETEADDSLLSPPLPEDHTFNGIHEADLSVLHLPDNNEISSQVCSPQSQLEYFPTDKIIINENTPQSQPDPNPVNGHDYENLSPRGPLEGDFLQLSDLWLPEEDLDDLLSSCMEDPTGEASGPYP